MNPLYSKLIHSKRIKINPSNLFYYMNFDGHRKEERGFAGAGAVIYDEQFKEVWGGSLFVGKNTTNNQSEYEGLILGLEQAIHLNIKSLIVRGDSQLIINHMTGKYKCNSPDLLEHFTKAKKLENEFEVIKYIHVLREYNIRAIDLSNSVVKDYYKNFIS